MKYQKIMAEVKKAINERYLREVKEIRNLDNVERVVAYMAAKPTDATRRRAEKLGLEKAKESAIDRIGRETVKKEEEARALLLAIENAPTADYMTVTVEWSRGHQAMASMRNGIEFIETGYTGGWGYDKETSAISEAFNRSLSMRKLLCEQEELRLATCPEKTRREFVGYGSGYGAIPSWEGGVGVSSYQTIFEKMGFEFHWRGGGKVCDTYSADRKEVAQKVSA